MSDRHSQTDEPELIEDPQERALAEAKNALRQFDVGMVLLDHWLDTKSRARYLRPSDLLTLNRFALEGVNRFAGTFRNVEVTISGSKHQPPRAEDVPALVEDFCDYVNSNWPHKTALHLAAYALWRINWIHPFADGNGRTARIISYVILSAKLGLRLPGTTTIPEQIAADKEPYYSALEAADVAFLQTRVDVSGLEQLIGSSLEKQLESSERASQVYAAEYSSRAVVTPQELLEKRVEFLEKSLRTYRADRPISKFIERNPVLFSGFFVLLAAVVGGLLGWFAPH